MFPTMRLQRAQRRVNSRIFGREVGTIRYSGGHRFTPAVFSPSQRNFPRAPVNSCAASPRKHSEFRRFEAVDMLRITCVDEQVPGIDRAPHGAALRRLGRQVDDPRTRIGRYQSIRKPNRPYPPLLKPCTAPGPSAWAAHACHDKVSQSRTLP
jgi:hypothetical protein